MLAHPVLNDIIYDHSNVSPVHGKDRDTSQNINDSATSTSAIDFRLGPAVFASNKITVAIDAVAGGGLIVPGEEMKAKITIRQDLRNSTKRKSLRAFVKYNPLIYSLSNFVYWCSNISCAVGYY